MATQNPDDFQSRPIRFRTHSEDKSFVDTFGVRAPWEIGKNRDLGEMTIRHSFDGDMFISITMEDGWQGGK